MEEKCKKSYFTGILGRNLMDAAPITQFWTSFRIIKIADRKT
jgi:hypothetical protein